MTSTTFRRAFGLLLLTAFVLRLGLVMERRAELSIDRDAYLLIAKNLADGEGFCAHPGHPTAFRPPLYPLLLAGCRLAGAASAPLLIGLLQALLSTLTVALTARFALQLGLPPLRALLAAALVTVDPVLLQYVAQPMTETLFTGLIALLLISGQNAVEKQTSHAWILSGLWFGLAALCRPTVWVFGAFVLLYLVLHHYRMRRTGRAQAVPWRSLGLFAAPLLLVVTPWIARNAFVLGRPVLTTTHGGYTLVLGNNDVFQREVVDQPGQPAWRGDSLDQWQRTLLDSLGDAQRDELLMDELLKRRGWDWIVNHPREFRRAAVYRWSRLWAVSPRTDTEAPGWILKAVLLWLSVVLLTTLLSVVEQWRRWCRYPAGLLLIISLTALHTFYWADTRMRAPAIPVLAVLAAALGAKSLQTRPPACGDAVA